MRAKLYERDNHNGKLIQLFLRYLNMLRNNGENNLNQKELKTLFRIMVYCRYLVE